MADQLETLRLRVQERLTAVGKSAHAVSLEIGANPGYVRDLLDPEKGGMPSAERLNRLAAALATTTDYFMARVEGPAQPVSEVSFGEVPQAWRASSGPGIPVLGTGYCADLTIEDETGAVLHIEQALFEEDHVVRMIERPAALWAARDAYAIYFHGDSMEPRFFQGEMGIVDPRRPPSPGDYVLAQLTDGASEEVVTVLVKQLVRATSKYLELSQYNPALCFRLDRGRVKRLHRICRPDELLGR